jgi:hypothetical protein
MPSSTDGAWNPRETELASAARGFGFIGLFGPIVVWGYAGWIALQSSTTNHSQRYLLRVLSVGSDLFLIPSLLAVLLGFAGVLRPSVGRSWRMKAGLGLVLGLVGFGATAARWFVASRT